jgi:single-strand DNA-binding protein
MFDHVSRITAVGRVGKQPDMRVTPQGISVTKFSLGVTTSHKSSDGTWQKNTSWYRVETWRKLAELVEKHVHQGDLVFVEGTLRLDEYTDKNGQPQHMLIIADAELQLLQSKRVNGDYAEAPIADSAFVPQEEAVTVPSNGSSPF